MKGLTPLVATVLLIGFTIAVGTLLGIFINTFMRRQTQEIQNPCLTFVDLKMKIENEETVKVLIDYSYGSIEIKNATLIVVCENITKKELGVLSPGNITSISLAVKNCTPNKFLIKLSGICDSSFQTIGYCENDPKCII